MENFIKLIQLTIALSVAFVWIFRFDNVARDFRQFGLSDTVRSFVGASKIAISTLLVVGIWYPSFVLIPAAVMGLFMLAAQYFHYKIRNPFNKHLPSLVLLVLCAFLVATSL